MPFFENATDVDARHGVFNEVRGSQHNEWTHNLTHNINSGNTLNHTIRDSYNTLGKRVADDDGDSGYVGYPSQSAPELAQEGIGSRGPPHWPIGGMSFAVSNPEIPDSVHPPIVTHSMSSPDPYFQPPDARHSPSPSLRSTPDLIPRGSPRHTPDSPPPSIQGDHSMQSPNNRDVVLPNWESITPGPAPQNSMKATFSVGSPVGSKRNKKGIMKKVFDIIRCR